MCHPLSCCHGLRASALSAPLYPLLRLQVASAHELAAAGPARLPERLAAYHEQLQAAVQAHHRTSATHAQELTEELLTSLLLEHCCREAVRQAVPLAQALGLAHGKV